MPSFSTLTSYSSTPDRYGICYYLSIDPFSSKSHRNSHVQKYEGLAICSQAFFDQTIVSVTFLKGTSNNHESRAFAEKMLRLNDFVQKGTLTFNNKLNYQSAMRNETVPLINVQEMLMTQIDSTSKVCKRKKGEYCVFSDKLSSCKIFFSSGRDRPCSYKLLNAFVHHFFCFAGGQMMLDNLRGVYSINGGFTLKMPTIHSLTGDCGPDDGGKERVWWVIRNHECNDYCRHLQDMRSVFTTCTG